MLFDQHDKAYPYDPCGDFPLKGEAGMTEPFTTLAFIAAITERLRLGTGVCLVHQRNPLYTAKEVANLDWLSGGRVDFGIGVGWQREEFEALGVSVRAARRSRAFADAGAQQLVVRLPSDTKTQGVAPALDNLAEAYGVSVSVSVSKLNQPSRYSAQALTCS